MKSKFSCFYFVMISLFVEVIFTNGWAVECEFSAIEKIYEQELELKADESILLQRNVSYANSRILRFQYPLNLTDWEDLDLNSYEEEVGQETHFGLDDSLVYFERSRADFVAYQYDFRVKVWSPKNTRYNYMILNLAIRPLSRDSSIGEDQVNYFEHREQKFLLVRKFYQNYDEELPSLNKQNWMGNSLEPTGLTLEVSDEYAGSKKWYEFNRDPSKEVYRFRLIDEEGIQRKSFMCRTTQ